MKLPKGIRYFNKTEKETYKIGQETYSDSDLTEEERVVTRFLKEKAKEVLEATSRGETVPHLREAKVLLEKLKQC